jgi:hypothetical protein
LNKKNPKQRMAELMIPIDNQIMMCDDRNDLMLLASAMLSTSKQIFVTNLGVAGTKILLKELLELMEHDEVVERIEKKNGKASPKNKGSNL